ncbi:hypothetical protein CA12_08430 [Alienimonas californiensis]|uniref:Uncharacterized protein n=1 Tax=Alienimonas californiensis TaxID=2527989 RepID=A0A517P5W3_9PLAN|nr:hypothetical protein CA12_08430 [Alienimonas californiensis]
MPIQECATVGLVSGVSVAAACMAVLMSLESTAPTGSSIAMSLMWSQGAVLGLGLAIGPTCGVAYWYFKRK